MKKLPILILSGWRVSGTRYEKLQSLLEKEGFTVYAPDLPGFGNEKLTKQVMTVDDYVVFVKNYLKKHHITKVNLICHSFGGRVGAKLVAQNPALVAKLILTGTPLIKQRLSLKKEIIIAIGRIGKTIFSRLLKYPHTRKLIYYLLGEWDYYKAPKDIRKTFKEVIKEDIAPVLPNIKVPTYVIWGENDTFVPKKIGKEIARRIPFATYTEIPFASHKLPYEYPEKYAQKILEFIS